MTTLDGSWLTALIDGVVGLMDLIGAPGAGVAIALENLFPPLPSEVILPMAGLAAARGSFGHSASDPGDGNGRGVMDAELRQAVRRTSAKRVTPGRDFTGR